MEEINKDFNGDSSISLMNIFNIKSIKIVKFVDFFVYLFTIGVTVIEFILSYMFIIDNQNRFRYLSNSYNLLNDIVYTKYLISEAVLVNVVPNYTFINKLDKNYYLSILKDELANYRQNISDTINEFNSAIISFSKEY